ncbi:MAG: mandelate racemase/muconate lactonizing enzyme family protein, partial [Proteobacteria bacterium]|nr:mandelate racemase/muconate lactonizing enzyme family protein [Pseudomonadota bacterium]
MHTADGQVGLGEVGHFSTAAEAIMHDLAPRFLIGEDATRIDHLWTKIHDHLAIFTMGGSEMRALGAIDVALWDLAGKRHGVPIYELLGGASRDTIPVYNTCIGSDPIPDNRRFLEDAGSLATELIDEG